MNRFAVLALLMLPAPAVGQDDVGNFVDGRDGAKIHTASGFACPARIGRFERDAVGIADIETGSATCSYAGLNSVYGTITLSPLAGPYDARSALARQFVLIEGTGGKRASETTLRFPGTNGDVINVFTRTYDTARAESVIYRTTLAATAVSNWAVEATVEYASPRDAKDESDFLKAVYAAAEAGIARH